MNISIRKAAKSDLKQIITIENLSFPDPWSSQIFKAELLNEFSNTFVAELDQKTIIGYIIFWLIADEAHILNLAVSPSFRKQKFGKTLVGVAIKEAKKFGATSIYLEVRPSNLNAMTLYQKFGFIYVATRKKYYPNGEDANIMELKL